MTRPSGRTTISGTVSIPPSPRAAAVLISGSGDLDRDGNTRQLPPGISCHIAAALAATNVVSLRYYKRGVGASGGNFFSAGFSDNIDDASAASAALRAQPESLRRDDAPPTMGVYRRLSLEPVDDGVLQEISDWIKKLTVAQAGHRGSAEG